MSEICTQNIKLQNKFTKSLAHLHVPVASQAKDSADRIAKIANGTEVLARGQKATAVDEAVIKDMRSRLNKVIKDCAPLDENSVAFDRELEQRVALFQTRHVATDKNHHGQNEIDGIVGKKTWDKLKELSSSDGGKVPEKTKPLEEQPKKSFDEVRRDRDARNRKNAVFSE